MADVRPVRGALFWPIRDDLDPHPRLCSAGGGAGGGAAGCGFGIRLGMALAHALAAGEAMV